MITLSQAFRLCGVRNDQIVYLQPHKSSCPYPVMMTGREVREKLDMKKVKVLKIFPLRNEYGLGIVCMAFRVVY